MPVGQVKDIAASCPQDTRLLGVDLGTKTLGLAVCDAGQGIATSLETIRRTKFSDDIKALEQIVTEFEIGGFVFGWPLNMDGSAGASCDRVRSFVDELGNYPQIVGTDPWIALWDERLSTDAVDKFLVESVDMSRARRAEVVDKLAAQIILQGALDYMKR